MATSVARVGDIERDLRQAGKGYVLGVNSNHWFASWGKPQRVAGTAEEIAKTHTTGDRAGPQAEHFISACTWGGPDPEAQTHATPAQSPAMQ